MITTKYDISAFQIKKALEDVVKNSQKLAIFAASCKENYIEGEKSKIRISRIAALSETNEQKCYQLRGEELNSRKNIDKVKFIKAITQGHSDTVSKRFKALFGDSAYLQKIEVVFNPFRFHSEINAINYLRAHHLILDTVDSLSGEKIPYQYIGGSILSCGQCSCLVRGAKDLPALNEMANSSTLVFFMRGHYNFSYPAYVLPEWALRKIPQRQMVNKLLNEATKSIGELSIYGLYRLQDAELSDSNDD